MTNKRSKVRVNQSQCTSVMCRNCSENRAYWLVIGVTHILCLSPTVCYANYANQTLVQLCILDPRGKSAAWIRRSRSPKVTDFGSNRKRVCEFLSVRHSNFGHILHRLGDIAGFLCSRVTPPLFRPNFRGVPVARDHPCWGQLAHKP